MDESRINMGEPEDGSALRKKDHFQTRLQSADGQPAPVEGHRAALLEEFRRRQQMAIAPQPAANDVQPPELVRSKRESRVAQPGEPGQLNWTPLGPAVMKNGQASTNPAVSGRIQGIAFSANGQRVYIASANGGVWRSDSMGTSWYPLMNGFDLSPMANRSDSLSMGAIAVPPNLPNRIYAGSGEGATSGDSYYGVGPVVSEDGGLNWQTEPSDSPSLPSEFFKLEVDPNDPEYVMAATNQGILRRQPRNQNAPNLPVIKPQSYLLKYNPGTGPAFDYWDTKGTFLKNAWTGAAGGAWVGDLAFFSLLLNKIPHFLTYNAATGDYVLYQFPGNAQPAQVSNGAFAANLQLMPFEMNGFTYMVKYDPAGGNAELVKWEDNGAVTNQWLAGQNWGAGYVLSPLVLDQVPMFLRYKPADGETMLRRWRTNLTVVDAWLATEAWEANKTILSFQYLSNARPSRTSTLAYGVDGSYTLYLWDGTTARRAQRKGANGLPANSALVPYVFKSPSKTESRFFAYQTADPGKGITVHYAWGNQGPVPFRKEQWAPDRTFMPILMGYEWSNRQASVEPLPHANGVEQRRVSSVAVAREGDVTVWYAAYWYPPTGAEVVGQGPVYYSLDRGETWKSLGFFHRQQGRITLATQPGNVFILYAFTELGQVYRMDRGGDLATRAWNQILGVPANLNSNYVLSMAVAPDNPNRIYLGGTSTSAVIGNNRPQYSASLYRCEVAASGALAAMNPIFIGFSVHGDVQTLQFDPQGALWVGCDGGLFYAKKPIATNAEENIHLFKAMNTGLSTLQCNHIGQWPNQDAVLFGSNQDNGCTQYAGEQTWEVVFKGDSGRVIVNWRDPSKVIVTYINADIFLSATAGAKDTFVPSRWIPDTIAWYQRMGYFEPTAFYAPMVTTPVTGTMNQADRLAFGTTRPWISNDFGMSWYPISTNAPAIVPTQTLFPNAWWGDQAHEILAMCFTSYTNLYVGMRNGDLFRIIENPPGTWTPEQLNGKNVAGGLALPVNWPVTGMARAAGNGLFVTFGGPPAPVADPNGFRRVWKYDPAGNANLGEWTCKSGDPATQTNLFNIQYNAIALQGNDVYAAADVGIWHSADAGDTWAPFSQGLPESAVLDLQMYPATGNCPNLLRAATYGRGIYEKVLDDQPRYRQAVQLYLRANILDRGLYDITPLDGQDNPLNLPGPQVNHRDGVGLKITQANAAGEFPFESAIDFYQFDAQVVDEFRNITAGRKIRMYLEVDNRGIVPADDVQVMLLISRRVDNPSVINVPVPPATVPVNITPLSFNGILGPGPQAPYVNPPPPPPQPTNTNPLPPAMGLSIVSPLVALAAPPDLPNTLQADVRAGNLIQTVDWTTMAIVTFSDLMAGFPDIVSVDWDAPVAGLYYLVAIVHAPKDPFTQPAMAVPVDNLVKSNSKVLMKCLMVP